MAAAASRLAARARRLCLKGGPDEEAVLCSASRTFAVKSVETTNLVLLVQQEEEGASQGGAPPPAPALGSHDPNVQPTPPGQLTGLATQLSKNAGAARCAPVVACAVAGAHLELVPAAPRLHRLDALLGAALYGGEGSPQERAQWGGGEAPAGSAAAAAADMEADGGGGCSPGLTQQELQAAVQCSVGELRAALRERRALCLGKWGCRPAGPAQAASPGASSPSAGRPRLGGPGQGGCSSCLIVQHQDE